MLTSNSCVASRYRCPVMQSIEGCMKLRSVVATHTWIKTMLHFKVTVEVMFGDLGQTLRSAKMSVTSHCYFRAWQEWTNSIYVWMKGLQLRVSFFVNNFHSGVTRGLLLFGRWMLWSSCITMTTPSVMSCGKNRQTDRQLRWIKNLGALLISTALITVSLHSLPHLPPQHPGMSPFSSSSSSSSAAASIAGNGGTRCRWVPGCCSAPTLPTSGQSCSKRVADSSVEKNVLDLCGVSFSITL